MDNVNEIRKYFHFEEQLHPHDSDDDDNDNNSGHGYENKDETTSPSVDNRPVRHCQLTYFYMRNTFKDLLKLFIWEISRLSQYTHFWYRLHKDAQSLAARPETKAHDVCGDTDDDDKIYNYNQWDHNFLLQHFTFVSKRRSEHLKPFVVDYDLFCTSVRTIQSKTIQSVHNCNNRIVVVGQGAGLLYFLNYLTLR